MKTTIVTLLACSMVFSGCASNTRPPEWAYEAVRQRQQAEIDAKNKAAAQAAAQAEELKRLKAENEKIKAEAENAKKEQEMQAWVSANKKKITEELTKNYKPNAQKIMEAYGFQGTVLYYDIDDTAYENGILYFEQIIYWQKPDYSGGGARIVTGMEIKTEKYVYDNIETQKDFTYTELKSIMNGGQKEESQTVASSTPASSQSSPSFYERNKKEVDSAAIGVGAAAATAIIGNWINSMFQGQ